MLDRRCTITGTPDRGEGPVTVSGIVVQVEYHFDPYPRIAFDCGDACYIFRGDRPLTVTVAGETLDLQHKP